MSKNNMLANEQEALDDYLGALLGEPAPHLRPVESKTAPVLDTPLPLEIPVAPPVEQPAPAEEAPSKREALVLTSLAVAVLVLGIWPAPLIEVMDASIENLVRHIAVTKL